MNLTVTAVNDAPVLAGIEGVEAVQGVSCQTAGRPKEPVRFEGKRVAVVGTGATGVQTIQEVVKTAGHLTVFQRTPNWCAPLHNGRIDPETMAQIKAGLCRQLHQVLPSPVQQFAVSRMGNGLLLYGAVHDNLVQAAPLNHLGRFSRKDGLGQ